MGNSASTEPLDATTMEPTSNAPAAAPEATSISHILLSQAPRGETVGEAARRQSSTKPESQDRPEGQPKNDDTAPSEKPMEHNAIHASRPGDSSTEEEDIDSGRDEPKHDDDLDEEKHDDSHDNDDFDPNSDETPSKRAKRLAMNRASARERRRRKRVHTEELEKRVIHLSRQCIALQKTNEGLQVHSGSNNYALFCGIPC